MISLKSKAELEKMRKAGKIVANTLNLLKKNIKPGITTRELDALAAEFIAKKGGNAAFLGYRGYPASICASINEEVVHGIPSPRMVKDGDIISVDVGVELEGYYADAAATFAVGKIDKSSRELIEVTRQSLQRAINAARKGNRLSDISFAVQKYAEDAGFSVVRDFVGHGIGTNLHEEPQVPNFGKPGNGILLEPGMVLALEPMINAGTWKVEILEDGWTAVTADRKRSAHFEHTICITEGKAEILTQS